MGVRPASCLAALLALLLALPALAQDDIYVQPRQNARPAGAPAAGNQRLPRATADDVGQRRVQLNLLLRQGLAYTSLYNDPAAVGVTPISEFTPGSAVGLQLEFGSNNFGLQVELGQIRKRAGFSSKVLGGAGMADTTVTIGYDLQYVSMPVMGRIRLLTPYKDRLSLALLAGFELGFINRAHYEYTEDVLPFVARFDITQQVTQVQAGLIVGFAVGYWINENVQVFGDLRSGNDLGRFNDSFQLSPGGRLDHRMGYFQLNAGLACRLY